MKTIHLSLTIIFLSIVFPCLALENTHANLSGAAVPREYVLFESGQVRPLAMTHDGKYLFVTNTPDSHVEMFAITPFGLSHYQSIAVGLEPVALAITPDDKELWVVNHLSDSVSVIDIGAYPAKNITTLWVGDEPRDIVFAGNDFDKAFITTAHRGQHIISDPQLFSSGVKRADVWVFDRKQNTGSIAGTPLRVVSFFGDTPRALAASNDGSKVYVGIFKSGNKTTTLPPAAIRSFPKPPPLISADRISQPESGIIVKLNNGRWVDELNRNYNNVVGLNLPDYDVFTLDANSDNFTQTDKHSGVGTVLFNIAVNPQNGDLFVTNIDSRNQVRFEGTPAPGRTSVRGHLADNRISIIKGNDVLLRNLNKHLDFNKLTGDEGDRNTSISMPLQLQFNNSGSELYVAAYGSQKIIKYQTLALEDDSFIPNSDKHAQLSGGGPSGLVVDELNQKIYVMTRFDNGISTVDLAEFKEIDHIQMHNPEPESIIVGRQFMYDARKTSGFGNDSCATCHIFGNNDALAWDLGNPDGRVKNIPNSYHPFTINSPALSFTSHPMKGPMTTQSMRGLVRHGPQHWRGDRNGINPVNGETLEEAAFKEFNIAFDVLLAKPEQLSAQEMQQFTDFAMQITYPPNPNRNLDNSLTEQQQLGKQMYDFGVPRSNGNLETCAPCHVISPEHGIYGTTGQMSDNAQPGERDFKIPHFRDQYQKIGMFTSFPQSKQDQIRGFAFNHNGATSNNALFSEFGISTAKVKQLKSFLFAFPTETAAMVGQQLSINKGNFELAKSTLDQFILSASITFPVPQCDLTANTIQQQLQKQWLYDRNDNIFVADDESTQTTEELLLSVAESTNNFVFTCQPWGSGHRLAIDRDRDGLANAIEVNQGSASDNSGETIFKPHAGLWYNPLTSGRGWDIQLSNNNMVATWYTHLEDGTPIWYQAVAPLAQQWHAPLQKFQWVGSGILPLSEEVGNVDINFTSHIQAQLNWQVNNNSGTENIEPLIFSNRPADIKLSGLWHDPNDNGWGISIDSQGNRRVVVAFFYDQQNQPRWSISQSSNDLISEQQSTSVSGACPWCVYFAPVSTINGTLSLRLNSLSQLNIDINQNNADTNETQWLRIESPLIKLTD